MAPAFPRMICPIYLTVFTGLTNPASVMLAASGLGLAIAKSIVQNHGGRIWAESKLGEGSAFVIGLPLQQLPA